MKWLMMGLIRFYQKWISPMKGKPCCRFQPTCSQYALEAYREWGFFCGTALSIYRILRCNPFCRGGYDPVPVRKRKKKSPKKNIDGNDSESDPCAKP